MTGEIISIVQEAIEEGIPLWYFMCLDGDHLAIDESQLQLDPPRLLGLQTLPDLSSCHYQILEELVETFRKGYLKGYVSLSQAMETVYHVVEVVHTVCKNDSTLSMIPRVPGSKSRPAGPFEVWIDYTREIVKVPSESSIQLIDWRSLLFSLIDSHFHNFVRAATAEDILKAHNALKEAADGCSEFVQLPRFLATKFWFDTDNGYINGERMKRLMYSMLSSDDGLPWQSLLLYLCKDVELELALKKAHTAIRGTLSENVALTSQELLKALYPCGTKGASDEGCQIWSPQEIQKLLQGKPEQVGEACVSVRGSDELDENLTGSNALYARSTGACRGSKLSEQSLISFEVMPSEPQSISEKEGGITTSISSEPVNGLNASNQSTTRASNNEKRLSNIDISGKRPTKIDNKEMRMSNVNSTEMRASEMDDSKMRASKLGDSNGVRGDSSFGERQDEEGGEDEGGIAGSPLEVCSLFSEQAVVTMNEFLAACNQVLHESSNNDKGGAAVPQEGDEESKLAFSLPAVLTSELSSALQARFGTNSLLVMQPAHVSSSEEYDADLFLQNSVVQ